MAKRQGRNSRRTKPESKSRSTQELGRGRPVPPEELNSVLVEMGCRTWEADWKPFVESHGTWWDHARTAGPVYHLPSTVIDALSASAPASEGKRAVRPLISPADAAAERAFLKLCANWGVKTIGAWPHGGRIEYEIWGAEGCEIVLSEQHEDLVQSWVDAGHMPVDVREAVDAQAAAEEVDLHQRLGYVGVLMFHKPFRDEHQSLKKRATDLGLQDEALPTIGTLLRDSVPRKMVPRAKQVSGDMQAFLEAMGRFLQKWNLVRLVTWDLPLPQSPLSGAGAGLIAHLLGPDAKVDHTPAYFDVPSQTNLRQVLRKRQSQEGRAAGIDLKFPQTDTGEHAGSPSSHERAFRMWLVERTIRGRYATPRGLASRLVAVFRTVFGRPVSEDHVKRLRREYVHIMQDKAS